jgi:hypothetical protein
MYRTYDSNNGIGPRIYRNPSEIKTDIKKIGMEIDETLSMINIRSLLIDILSGDNAASPEKLIPDLEEAIYEAKDALNKLRGLKEELCMLEEELEETRCKVGSI